MGGIIVGVNELGELGEVGYYKQKYGTITKTHPDTRLEFKGIRIPSFDIAVNTAKDLHSYFYGIHSIGWDICIDEGGNPLFVEGNNYWDFMIHQTVDGGLKNKFLNTIQLSK